MAREQFGEAVRNDRMIKNQDDGAEKIVAIRTMPSIHSTVKGSLPGMPVETHTIVSIRLTANWCP